MKSVVLLSGGLDSATVLAKAREESEEVIAVNFKYGQPTEKTETKMARRLAAHYNISLIEKRIHNIIPKGGLTEENKDFKVSVEESGVSSGYVPFRNLLLITIGAGIGGTTWKDYNEKIVIWIGVQGSDFSAYADCREGFIKIAEIALQKSSDTQNFYIATPLIHLSKTEVLKEANKLRVPLHLTYSCYEPIEGKPCGKCGACEERDEAFQELEMIDPARIE